MEFKQGATVEMPTGDNVGHIARVVLDPRTKEVTHVVVRKGFLFTEDKVVPTSLIASATEDRVRLREYAGDLRQLPVFEETHYHPVNEAELSRESGQDRILPSAVLVSAGDRNPADELPVSGSGLRRRDSGKHSGGYGGIEGRGKGNLCGRRSRG